ncbi:ABC transporter permease [Streptosporangium sp. DT93]|uniref:ABC transporter permease n=1 Tax=Streptosporangium sp. DT93 TaxID=3393428 RepID=UPI003CF154F6
MTQTVPPPPPPPTSSAGPVRPVPPARRYRNERKPFRLIERNVIIYRRTRMAVLCRFLEPLFHLFSIGFGIGSLIGPVEMYPGTIVAYASFVGPALLASAVMNDAVYDTTIIMFAKLKYAKTYDAVLNTPIMVTDIAIGETIWIMIRTTAYSAVFMAILVALGLVQLHLALLALPAAVLLGFTFAALGMVAASLMRDYDDFEFVQLVVVPLSLLSATLYPLSVYPDWLAVVVAATPLYHGVALIRDIALGHAALDASLGHIAYLLVFGAVALVIARNRLKKMLIK